MCGKIGTIKNFAYERMKYPMNNKELMSVNDVASYLKVTPQYVRQVIDKKLIESRTCR